MTRVTARSVALEAVRRVIDEGAYSNRVVPALLARSGLDTRDRAFAAELAYGTLRRLIPIDRAIGMRASRPVERITPGARHVLRLGVYQLLFAAVAPHAAVGETVSLAGPGERGFVNAVLRRVADDPPPPPRGDGEDDISARTGLAPWGVRELRRLVGEEVEAAASALAERAPLNIRTNTCKTTTQRLSELLRASDSAVRPSRVDADCLLVSSGDPAKLPGYDDGWFAIQDAASAFVVRALGPEIGERIYDACAAPGGKAAFAACLVGERGDVVATDLHPGRLRAARTLGRRLGVALALVAHDARRPAVAGPFDRVLVDAPCSGVGSARRRPELLWRVPKDDLSRLARRQVQIAESAAAMLRPGGRLVYSVCTFPRAETDAACDALLLHRPELVPIETPGPDGDATRLRLWPHRHGCDAMFVAAFERRA
jgi:16S rRNA (cytosine967-C5)-methyltransferase